jgi:putative addiction module killer protein
MIKVIQSERFRKWVSGLHDHRAQAQIASRLTRLSKGMFGDTASVGEGVTEIRIHFGPGYRLYYTQRGATIVLLLCGGHKSTQAKDIRLAKRLAREWR